MKNTLQWLEFLDNYSIDDAVRAAAYESATPAERQCIKTAIAYHALQGESPYRANSFTEFAGQGFWHKIKKTAAPWLVAVSSPEYISPARLIAMLMPAILLQVPVFFVSLDEPAPSVLLTLELLGIENIYSLKTTHALLEALQAQGEQGALSHGRFVLMHHNLAICSPSSVRSLCPALQCLHIPYFEDLKPPVLHVQEGMGQEQRHLIDFAQQDATFTHDTQSFANACYQHTETRSDYPYAQVWQKGLEGCWVHAQYGKDFYYNFVHSAAINISKI